MRGISTSILVAVLGLSGLAQSSSEYEDSLLDIGTKVRDLELSTSADEAKDLRSLISGNRATVIIFWTYG